MVYSNPKQEPSAVKQRKECMSQYWYFQLYGISAILLTFNKKKLQISYVSPKLLPTSFTFIKSSVSHPPPEPLLRRLVPVSCLSVLTRSTNYVFVFVAALIKYAKENEITLTIWGCYNIGKHIAKFVAYTYGICSDFSSMDLDYQKWIYRILPR